jgi:hypothetical protein
MRCYDVINDVGGWWTAIDGTNGGTEVRFTQVGLVPEQECFDICHGAWTHYLGDSLTSLLTTGTGKPNTDPDETAG